MAQRQWIRIGFLRYNIDYLKLHRLSGKLSDLLAVLINISFRIILELLISEKEIIPINIGIYDDVYK